MRITGMVKIVVLAVSLALLAGCSKSENTPTEDPAIIEAPDPVNQKPIAIISSAAEQSITVGDTISFSGINSSDPDSNIPLSYEWTFSGAGSSLQSSTDAVPGEVSFSEVGVVTVSLVVADNLGLNSDPVSFTVNIFAVGINLPPGGSIKHDNGDGTDGSIGNIRITTGTNVVFGANAIDPEGDAITYAWNFPVNVMVPAVTGGTEFTANFPVAGIYIITLTVADSNGNEDPTPSQVMVTVTDIPVNMPPNGSISHDNGNGTAGSTGNINITTGADVVFSGSAIDPEGDSVTYAWNFPINVTVPATAGSTPFTANFPVVGTYLITLTVTDSNGNADPTLAQLMITVTDAPVNQPPNGSISHDNGNGTTGSTGNINITTGTDVVFSGSAIDPEGDSVTYAWNFPTNVTVPATPGSTPFTANFPVVGTYPVTLTVTDSSANADPTPAQLTVTVTDAPVNQPPNGSISHDNGNGTTGSTGNINITTGTDVVFSGSAIDPEGDAITYAWNFPINVTVPATPGSTPFTANFPVVGTYPVTLTVTDSNANADPTPAQVTVTVTDVPINLPPNGSISHDNGNGTTGSAGTINITTGATVIFNGSATDPEGEAITYSWIFEGATASSTTGSGPISVNYNTAGSFQVELTVSDSNGSPDLSPATVTVNVSFVLPDFQFLPVLSDEDGNPSDATATYNLTVDDNVNVNVVTPNGNWVTPMMRYNGLQLPPVIVAKRGSQMTMNVQNNLVEETTIHWHGFKIPAAQDGGPDAPIVASASNTYSFELVQPAGPLWFHPHADGTTATQVYFGLAGGFIVTDDITDSLETANAGGIKQLPSGNYDIPMLIQDRSFNGATGDATRTLAYITGGMMMGGAGALGDHVLVNGVEMPALKVETRQYRFRLFHGSNARTYDFALSNNATFMVVATDGGLLNAPVETDHIMLAPGERAEIIVDFGNYTVGDRVNLVSRSFNVGMMGGGGLLPNGAAFDVMRFDIETQATDDVVLYTSLPAGAEINNRLVATDAETTRSFVMSVSMVGMGSMQFLINGLSFDMNRVDETIPSGATEIWSITNASGMAHPFHAHAIQWQVLDRNGVPASGVDLGWKDTVLVPAGQNARIIGRFDPVVNVGMYMYHCHILEHEEAGMMGMFEVLP